MLRLEPPLVISVLLACSGQPAPKTAMPAPAAPTPAEPDEPAEPAPAQPAAPAQPDAPANTSTALDTYLAAIPAEPPQLSSDITGVPPDDADITIDRCKLTGWSYRGCGEVFPRQGREWVRWDCLHGEPPHYRASLCSRLAEYLYDGIGGPRDPALAVALFDRQCNAPDEYRMSCYYAAETLMFDDPTRALIYARRGCDSPRKSSIGCQTLMPALEAGLTARTVTVDKVAGLPGVAAGSTCKVWLWSTKPGKCGARLACGDAVLYGAGSSVVPCKDARTGGEDMTSAKDGDPSFKLDATSVVVSDDKSGPRGAFKLTGRVQ